MSFQAAEQDRQLQQVVEIGTVTAVEGDRLRADLAGAPSPPLPVMRIAMGGLRVRARIEAGEQVVVVAPGGDMARAFVLGTLPQGNDLPGAEALEIDLGGGTLMVTGGSIAVPDGDVTASGISLTTHVHGGVSVGLADTDGPQ
jgi:phage baseplate assembly protein gpV